MFKGFARLALCGVVLELIGRGKHLAQPSSLGGKPSRTSLAGAAVTAPRASDVRRSPSKMD